VGTNYLSPVRTIAVCMYAVVCPFSATAVTGEESSFNANPLGRFVSLTVQKPW
jgi:hypothetical protein